MNIKKIVKIQSIFLLISLIFIMINSGSALAATANQDAVQKGYIAYYARAAEPGGYDFWVGKLNDNGGDIQGIIDAFGNSPEYTDRFGNLDNETLVNNIYQNLFNRDSDPAGLAFYVGWLETGQSTLARISLQILNGAINDDLTIVNNKLEVAHCYTDGVRTHISYDTNTAISTLVSVDVTPASVSAAKTATGCDNGGQTVAPRIYLNIEDAFAGPVWSDVTLKFSGAAVKEVGGTTDLSQTILDADDATKILELEVSNLSARDDIIITASALGYLDTGASVMVSPDDAQHEIQLRMVKSIGNAVDGIHTTEMDITPYLDDNGITTQAINLESKADSSSPGVSISIPNGTRLTDKDGNPVTDGILSVTSFDPYKPRALAAFPGGFDVKADANGFMDGDGNAYTGEAEISFKTAGFAAISIKSSSGKKVKNFSQDVSLGMEVKQGTTDPNGTPIGIGTSIQVWSYEEETGKWDFESQNSTISGVKGGFGEISISTRHLSYWNLDWHYGPKCAPRFNFVLDNGDIDYSHYKFRLIVDSNPSIDRWMNYYSDDGFLQLYNVPANVSGKLEVYNTSGALLHTVDVANFCDSNNEGNIFDVVVPPPPPPIDTEINLSFACPNGAPIPGYLENPVLFDALLYPTYGQFPTTVLNGQGGVSLPAGTTQTYNVVPNNFTQTSLYAGIADQSSTTITVTGGVDFNHTFELSAAFCGTETTKGVGTINGIDISGVNSPVCDLPGDTDNDTSRSETSPRALDVARASNGDLYFSIYDPETGLGSIKKFIGNSSTPTLVMSGGDSNYPGFQPVSIGGNGIDTTQIKVKHPMGLDIHNTSLGDVLYYADYGAHCVNAIRLDTLEVIKVAGNCGSHGNSPNDGEMVHARDGGLLRNPSDVAMDNSGFNLFIADHVNRKVRMVGSDLSNDRLAEHLFAGSPAGSIRMRTLAGSIDPAEGNPADGGATQYPDGTPARGNWIGAAGIAVAPDNSVLITDHRRITRISNIGDNIDSPQNQTLTLVAGAMWAAGGGNGLAGGVGDGQNALNARFTTPVDVEVDVLGNILVSDMSEYRVRRIEANTNIINTVAGSGFHSWSPSCGIATQQTLTNVRGLWSDRNGGSVYDFALTQFGHGPNWVRQVRY